MRTFVPLDTRNFQHLTTPYQAVYKPTDFLSTNAMRAKAIRVKLVGCHATALKHIIINHLLTTQQHLKHRQVES